MSDIGKELNAAAAATCDLRDFILYKFEASAVSDEKRKDFIEKIKNILAQGANPDIAPHAEGGEPMWCTLLRWKDFSFAPEAEQGTTLDEKRAFYIDVVNLVLEHVQDILVDTGERVFKGTFLDSVYRLRNIEGAATAVICGIRSSYAQGDEYQIPLLPLYALTGHEDELSSGVRLELKENILNIHARVGERLANPQTPLEHETAQLLSGEGVNYWLRPMVFPDLEKLPVPTREMHAAVNAFLKACGHLPPQAVLHISTNETVQQAEEKLLRLVEAGKASYILRK